MTYWYLVKRHDGCTVSVHTTRHDAVGAVARYHECNDYEIRLTRPVMAPEDPVRFGGLYNQSTERSDPFV